MACFCFIQTKQHTMRDMKPELDSLALLKAELKKLDKETLLVNGKKLKPSQCYRLTENPTNFLFNTNCPENLKDKLNWILNKYMAKNNLS